MKTLTLPRWTAGLACLWLAGCASVAPSPVEGSLRSLAPANRELPYAIDHKSGASPAEVGVTTPNEPEELGEAGLFAGSPEPLSADVTESWFSPWPHNHFSKRGTPFVHMFSLEPAFLDRDVFLDYRSVKAPGGDEQELEVEVEWALTRRIGLVVEVPFTSLDPDGGPSESGMGDIAIGPRVLLIDQDTFLLSANLEVAIGNGNDRKGLGSGEVEIAPSLSAWFDLGNWVQANVQVGTEHGLDSGNETVFYRGALAYSFLTPALFGHAEHGHNHAGDHFPAGLTNVILEWTGRTILDGPGDGRTTAEMLLGFSYSLTGRWEARTGYQIPVGGVEDIDSAFVVSLVHHF